MCTLSLVARNDGFLLGMNRDERLSRGPALAPEIQKVCGLDAVFPIESSGGTWIAANQNGIAFALLNQNARHGMSKTRSRGEIIPELIRSAELESAARQVDRLDLTGFLPFLLVGISAFERRLMQWRFDGDRLTTTELDFGNRHWFSSGISDADAATHRAPICALASKSDGAGTAQWLRALHRDHGDRAGAFSICVHREDAATVSYSEVEVSRDRISFRYQPGNPCQPGPMIERTLSPSRLVLEH
jgi:hypothetical protein